MASESHASSARVWYPRRWVRIGALTVLIGAAIVVSAILQGDVPEAVSAGRAWIRHCSSATTTWRGFGLLSIPGFRVPITLAAGVFRVRYPVFAASVAVSTAIWAGIFLIVGINFGGRLEALLRVHRETSWLFVAFIVVAVSLSLFRRRRSAMTVSLEIP